MTPVYSHAVARDEEKIEELKASMQSLLNNMPALTFSKNVEDGRYLACNRKFAEYAHKRSPAEVVGLTDHDIFDKKTADHFVSDDKIALSMDEPYVLFEDAPDAAGNSRQFQTTKLKFIDETGGLCLPSAAAKLERFSDAFTFYANLTLAEDRQRFLDAVAPEAIIKNTENWRIYSVPFRRVFDSGIRYHRVEFARLKFGDNLSAIVLGFKDVDEEVRKEQQIQSAVLLRVERRADEDVWYRAGDGAERE